MDSKDIRQRRDSEEKSSRVLKDANGLIHHVTLTNWHWIAMDHLSDTGKMDIPTLVAGCWEDCNAEGADPALWKHLRYNIHGAYLDLVVAEEDGLANDCLAVL